MSNKEFDDGILFENFISLYIIDLPPLDDEEEESFRLEELIVLTFL